MGFCNADRLGGFGIVSLLIGDLRNKGLGVVLPLEPTV